jgi:hypothetical protein
VADIVSEVRRGLELYGIDEGTVGTIELGMVEVSPETFFNVPPDAQGTYSVYLAEPRDVIVHGDDWWIDHLGEEWVFHCTRTFPRLKAPLS